MHNICVTSGYLWGCNILCTVLKMVSKSMKLLECAIVLVFVTLLRISKSYRLKVLIILILVKSCLNQECIYLFKLFAGETKTKNNSLFVKINMPFLYWCVHSMHNFFNVIILLMGFVYEDFISIQKCWSIQTIFSFLAPYSLALWLFCRYIGSISINIT